MRVAQYFNVTSFVVKSSLLQFPGLFIFHLARCLYTVDTRLSPNVLEFLKIVPLLTF